MRQLLSAVAAVFLAGQIAIPQKTVDTRSYVIKLMDNKRVAKTTEIREFLWKHWHEHLLGRLIETKYSKEGVRSDTTYSFEPDTKGTWTIRVRSRWSDSAHDPVEYRVYSVKQVEPPRDGLSPLRFVSEENRSASTYRLIFYDATGKRISRGSW